MHDNVTRNLKTWDGQYKWPKDGDEWAGQAALCGVPYEAWKESLIRHLIQPHLSPQSAALEIAPGHGRWTEHLVRMAGHVTVVDISASCLDFCRGRFQGAPVDYFLTVGDSLPRHAGGRIDFVWSYDAFVHMHPDLIRGYVGEIARVLKPGGEAIIHHSNVENAERHEQEGSPGWRSAMTEALMRDYAKDAGLTVVSQFVYWDETNKIGVPRFGDRITRLRR